MYLSTPNLLSSLKINCVSLKIKYIPLSGGDELARRCMARGPKSNHQKAVALIFSELLEGIWDGRTAAELVELNTRTMRKTT